MHWFQITQRLLLVAITLFPLVGHATDTTHSVIRLATTTSTYHSGLLDALLPRFTKQTGYQVQVLATGSGKALKMGEMGDVDIVLTHSPAAEKSFVEAGFGVQARPVMYNDFIVLGPRFNPAQITAKDSVDQAFAKIAQTKSLFISRGDDSGTHKKELAIWQSAHRQPNYSNYKSIGQGMGPTLNMSSELQAYTLTDRGTWLAYKNKLDLTVVVQGDPALFNPYQIIRVNPTRYSGLNVAGAKALSDWMVSETAQNAINQFNLHGETLFTANADNRK